MIRARVACHVHSDWSYDAAWPLERLAAAFARRGYDAVLISEHEQGFDEERRCRHRSACAAASTEHTLLIPGIEYSDPETSTHILVWGNVPFIGEGVGLPSILRAVSRAGGIAVLAHPSRKKTGELLDTTLTDSLSGVELWNRKEDGWAPSTDAIRLHEKTGLRGFVGLDFHCWRQFFPLAMAMSVADRVTEDAVLLCMRAGRCCPEFWGVPESFWTHGPFGKMLHAAEMLRRPIARVLRQLGGRHVGGGRQPSPARGRTH